MSNTSRGEDLMTDLVDELDAFDPKWREHYATLGQAVQAAGGHAVAVFREFIKTPEGQALVQRKATVVDWNKVNEKNRAQAQADLSMARSTGEF